jgi:hypothetical protein
MPLPLEAHHIPQRDGQKAQNIPSRHATSPFPDEQNAEISVLLMYKYYILSFFVKFKASEVTQIAIFAFYAT